MSVNLSVCAKQGVSAWEFFVSKCVGEIKINMCVHTHVRTRTTKPKSKYIHTHVLTQAQNNARTHARTHTHAYTRAHIKQTKQKKVNKHTHSRVYSLKSLMAWRSLPHLILKGCGWGQQIGLLDESYLDHFQLDQSMCVTVMPKVIALALITGSHDSVYRALEELTWASFRWIFCIRRGCIRLNHVKYRFCKAFRELELIKQSPVLSAYRSHTCSRAARTGTKTDANARHDNHEQFNEPHTATTQQNKGDESKRTTYRSREILKQL